MGCFRWLGSVLSRQHGWWSLPIALALVVAGLVTLPVRAAASPAPTVPTVSPSQLPPADAYQSFVQASYHDFMARLPADEELSRFSTALRTGTTSRQAYLTNLSVSDQWTRAIVTKMYRDTLQRDPDPTGLGDWSWWLRSGKYSVAQVASFFYASDEYYNDHAGRSASTWVTQLYQKLLNRNPDPLGLAFWVGKTNAAQYGRAWVAYNFYQSDESRAHRVDALYQTLLARGPDPVGLAFWKVQVLSTGDLVLATQIAGSQEYWDKAHVRYPSVILEAVIDTDALPEATVGSPYSATLVGSGGVPPYTWADVGLISPDLTVDPSTGVISGTPTSDGTLQMQITLADTTGRWKRKIIPLPIVKPLHVVTSSLPYAVTNSAYAATLVGEGGHPPYTWAASGLPTGITVDATTGALSGTPTALGSSAVTITLTDTADRTTTAALTLLVQKDQLATQVSAGGRHTCALTSTGAVRCWGGNFSGQLGDGTTTNALVPVGVQGLPVVVAISAGDYHTCALTTGGAVKCWGDNEQGQLGNGTYVSSSTPVDVVGLSSGVVAISAGGVVTCALLAGGAVTCWGENSVGALGDGTNTSSATPRSVTGLSSGVAAISVGAVHGCALTTGGAVKCWGGNWSGQLGDGTTTDRSTPVDVSGLGSGVVAIGAGRVHTCAVKSGGTVACWGNNNDGDLGAPTPAVRWPTPVTVVGLTNSVALVAGGDSDSCAVTSEGALTCWGSNAAGQLGDGTTSVRSTPANVLGMSSGVTAVDLGIGQACALTNQGGVKCWGDGGVGERGDGTTKASSTPVDVYGFKAP